MSNRDQWIKFYPLDYLTDLELQTCSMAAQGVYMRLLCLMTVAREYGFCVINGYVPDTKMLSRLIQGRYQTVDNAVTELLQKGVLKQDERGALYSQRLRSDWEKRQEMKRRGGLGGNPALVNQGPEKQLKADKNKNKNKSVGFSTFWTLYPRKEGKKDAEKAYNARLTEGYTPADLLTACKNYSARIQRDKTEPKFVKLPKTFLGPGGHITEALESPVDPACGSCQAVNFNGEPSTYCPVARTTVKPDTPKCKEAESD